MSESIKNMSKMPLMSVPENDIFDGNFDGNDNYNMATTVKNTDTIFVELDNPNTIFLKKPVLTASDGEPINFASNEEVMEDEEIIEGEIMEDEGYTKILYAVDTEEWGRLPSTLNENILKLNDTYNPYISILQLGKKEELVSIEPREARISLDCRPYIKKEERYSNIKPLWLLDKMAEGNNYRASFFWIEIFKKSVEYEILLFKNRENELIYAYANICFIIHSFLYMMTELCFKLKENHPDFSKRDSNNGEKYVYLLLGIEKQLTKDSGFHKTRKYFKKLFSEKRSSFDPNTCLDEYFDLDIRTRKYVGTSLELLQYKVNKIWNKIESMWEDSFNNNTTTVKESETDKRNRWYNLFSECVKYTPTNIFSKKLKDIITILLPKIAAGGGGNDESDISLVYKKYDRYTKLNVSIKNIEQGSTRLGKTVASKFYNLHMGLTMTVLGYLKKNEDSTPKLKKLSYLFDCKGNNTESGYTVYDGAKCGEIGKSNLIILSFIIRELFLHFYQEFVWFDALFKKLYKQDKIIKNLLSNILDHTSIEYLLQHKFNYWRVHEIALRIINEHNILDKCTESYKHRHVAGVPYDDLKLKKNIGVSILKNILADTDVMRILSYLSHQIPKEVDVNVMNMPEYLTNPSNYHPYTVDLSQIMKIILLSECLGDRRETNESNTMLIVVTQEEILTVSTINKDKMLSFIWSTGQKNGGEELKIYPDMSSIIKSRTRTSSDRLMATVSQMKPKGGILDIPMSKNERTTKDILENFNVQKYYMDSYNKYYRLIYRFLGYYNFKAQHNELVKIAGEIAKTVLEEVENKSKRQKIGDGSKQTHEQQRDTAFYLERSMSGNMAHEAKIDKANYVYAYYNQYYNKHNTMLFDKMLEDLASAIVSDKNDRSTILQILKRMFKKKIDNGKYDFKFELKKAFDDSKALNKLVPDDQQDDYSLVRAPSAIHQKNLLPFVGGKKINTGLKKEFNGKIKNIYKMKGSKLYYIIHDKKLISVNQYKKDLILNKSKILNQKQSHSLISSKLLIDKSNISKYNLRIEQYKNKNLSDYFINKLKNYINDTDNKNNIYKIGIKKIKVILKDIYKINK